MTPEGRLNRYYYRAGVGAPAASQNLDTMTDSDSASAGEINENANYVAVNSQG